MGKLQHLMGNSGIRELTESLAEKKDGLDVWLNVLNEVAMLMRNVSERLNLVEEVLAEMEFPDSGPAIEEVRSSLDEYRKASAVEIRKVADRVAAIKIPVAKEPPKIDLSPILAALNALKHQAPPAQPEHHAHEWTFDIQRDRYGLIQSVVAKAT